MINVVEELPLVSSRNDHGGLSKILQGQGKVREFYFDSGKAIFEGRSGRMKI